MRRVRLPELKGTDDVGRDKIGKVCQGEIWIQFPQRVGRRRREIGKFCPCPNPMGVQRNRASLGKRVRRPRGQHNMKRNRVERGECFRRFALAPFPTLERTGHMVNWAVTRPGDLAVKPGEKQIAPKLSQARTHK